MPKSSNATTAAKLHEEIDNGWKFCEKQSKSIEVSYKNDHGEQTLAKVHFRDHDQKTVRHNYIHIFMLLVFVPVRLI